MLNQLYQWDMAGTPDVDRSFKLTTTQYKELYKQLSREGLYYPLPDPKNGLRFCGVPVEIVK
jgi:hypothetical protein